MDLRDKLTFLCVPLSAVGHTFATLGIAHPLKEKGHRVVFATERSWQGKIAKFGFEEYIYDQSAEKADSHEKWSQIIASFTETIRKPSIQQVLDHPDIFGEIFKIVKYVGPQFEKMIEKIKPNVIIEDFLILPPSLVHKDIPLIRMVSQAPLIGFDDRRLPPPCIGLPTHDSSKWSEVRILLQEAYRYKNKIVYDLLKTENKFISDISIEKEVLSKNLNIYMYPKAAVDDYLKLRPLDNTWVGVDHAIRHDTSTFEVPEKLKKRGGKLIYFSLGSMGSAIDELMERFLKIFETSPHNFIVSLGVNYEKYSPLPENVWGESFLPQLAVLPHVDLVLTHGGNNTFVESLYFGKQIIVLPLFVDQFENAQRAIELNIGLKFNAFEVTGNELNSAIEEVLHSKQMKENVEKIGKQMRESKSMEKCVERILYVARNPIFPTI